MEHPLHRWKKTKHVKAHTSVMSLLASGEGDWVKVHPAVSRLSIAEQFLSLYCFSGVLLGLLSACCDFLSLLRGAVISITVACQLIAAS